MSTPRACCADTTNTFTLSTMDVIHHPTPGIIDGLMAMMHNAQSSSSMLMTAPAMTEDDQSP